MSIYWSTLFTLLLLIAACKTPQNAELKDSNIASTSLIQKESLIKLGFKNKEEAVAKCGTKLNQNRTFHLKYCRVKTDHWAFDTPYWFMYGENGKEVYSGEYFCDGGIHIFNPDFLPHLAVQLTSPPRKIYTQPWGGEWGEHQFLIHSDKLDCKDDTRPLEESDRYFGN